MRTCRNSFCLLIVIVALISSVANAKSIAVKSPDGETEFILNASENLSYSVIFNGSTIIENGKLGLKVLKSPAIGKYLEIVESSTQEVNNTWQAVQKQHESIVNHYNELSVDLEEIKFPGRKLKVIVRAYNDGVAFRYLVPFGADRQKCNLEKELTTFNFTDDVTCWAADYKSFKSHQEEPFEKQKLSELSDKGFYGLPMTVKIAGNCYAAITEAHLNKWAGMYLKTATNATELSVDLSNIKNDGSEEQFICKLELPHQSPWRVIMLGEKPGDLVESEIIMNLNPECEIENADWIKPGLCAWDSWWSRGVKMENDEIKKYIDLASGNGFPYMLIDWQWYGMYNKPEADVTTVADQLDMPMLLDYAKQKNVKLWLWLYWTDVTRNMEEAFKLYESWGIVGIKIDFMALDGAEMVEWYHNTVKLAAKYHLMVNFHGAYKPTGFRRTYPNLMTREGVLGNEYNKWSYMVTPEHNVTLPFTRMLAGHMDYTPGGFRNSSKGEFKPQINTRVMGTRCHELAKFVVFDSPITTVCDHPENYEDEHGMDFLQNVKTVWDDTKVLQGEIGEYIVMARRSTDQWFIAGMTNSDKRTLEISLDFLNDGNYKLQLYKDGDATKNDASKLEFSESTIGNGETLTVNCASGGGFVGIISGK
jgi:alpha-glucosidase